MSASEGVFGDHGLGSDGGFAWLIWSCLLTRWKARNNGRQRCLGNGRSIVRLSFAAVIFQATLTIDGYTKSASATTSHFGSMLRNDKHDLVIAYVAMQYRLRRLEHYIFSKSSRRSSDFHQRAVDFHLCYEFNYTDLYARFHYLIDHMDTAPFKEEGDFRRDRYDNAILRNPKTIAVDVKMVISNLHFNRGYYDPIDKYAEYKSKDKVLANLCRAYLNAK